jgi:hypothetical protein
LFSIGLLLGFWEKITRKVANPTGPTNPGQRPQLPPPPIPVTATAGRFTGDCADPYYSYLKHIPIQWATQPTPPPQRYPGNEFHHLFPPPQRPEMYLVMQNRFRQMEKQQNMDKREIYELRMAAMKMRMHDTGDVFKI